MCWLPKMFCQNSKQGRQKKVKIDMESVKMQCENNYYSVQRAIFGIAIHEFSLSKISSFSIAIQDKFQKIICVLDIIFTFCI